MNAKDAIKHAVEFCHMVSQSYLEDLTDDQLLVRSVVGSNHIAWQLGHLIASDHQILTWLGHTPPALPEDFEARHTNETAASDDPAKFHKKAIYIDLMNQTKTAVLAAVDATPEADLDKPAPEQLREHFPTVGAVLMLLGMHWMMHGGQFVPIRRKLGKLPMF